MLQAELDYVDNPGDRNAASDAARTACFALDERGERKGEVPVAPAPGGCCIEIGPQYRTVWYEIAVSGNPPQRTRVE